LDYLVYSTAAYEYYSHMLCRSDHFSAGHLKRVTFPDGERYQRLTSSVRGKDVVLVGGTVSDSDTLELFDLACGISYYGANSLTLVVPYYGYSTMERADKQGDIVTGKTRALLLAAIPEARSYNEIVLVDLHTEGTTHYFEGHLRSFHIHSKSVVSSIVGGLEDAGQVVLASTDAGRAKWVEAMANQMGVPAAFVYKRRLSGELTEIAGINADVNNRHVVIYDDMIRTGGSLIKAGQAYKDAGAARLTVITTHGVLPGDALKRIQDSGIFHKVYVTDTHPRVLALAPHFVGFLEIRSMVGVIEDFLVRKEKDPL